MSHLTWIIVDADGNPYSGTVDRNAVFGDVPALFQSYLEVSRRAKALRKAGYATAIRPAGSRP